MDLCTKFVKKHLVQKLSQDETDYCDVVIPVCGPSAGKKTSKLFVGLALVIFNGKNCNVRPQIDVKCKW